MNPFFAMFPSSDISFRHAVRRMAVFMLLIASPMSLFSCSEPQPEPESLEAAISQYLEENEFEAAFKLLEGVDGDGDAGAGAGADGYGLANAGNADELRARVHLAYANYLTHEADHLAMSTRMSDALRNYRRVVQLDPENTQAQSHIELIEGIYKQMGRDIPEGIAE